AATVTRIPRRKDAPMTAISMRVLGEATLQELREAVRGDVVTPPDADYDDARGVWNGAHDGRPAVIARCMGAADVIASVGFARSNDLEMAVRGGGHSLAGFSTCDDGIVIDLSQMNEVRVDPEARRAYVGGGAVWADVDPAVVTLTTVPPLPAIPEEWHGKKVVALLAVSAGPLEEGEKLVESLGAVAEPIVDLLGPMPCHVIQTLIDPLWERGINAYF